MRFRVEKLELSFKKEKEELNFDDFNWFHGQMGAGKSTIARLIDFCLGGNLNESEMTPALQSEFNSACLSVRVENTLLLLRRERGSHNIRASWNFNDEPIEVIVPARKAAGEVIPESGIEVVSDIIFVIAGRAPPRVRKGQIKKDSELTRLSFRDLWWYCYLDQDSMDSSFFNLDRDAHPQKRLKSRDVLRFVIGFYQEQVSQLEVELEQYRQLRVSSQAGALAMKEALKGTDIESRVELNKIKEKITSDIELANNSIKEIRQELEYLRPTHAVEILQTKAKNLHNEIMDMEIAYSEITSMLIADKEHKNELLSLSTKFRRSQSAREVLQGVNFEDCPSCGRVLPEREACSCSVCGQKYLNTNLSNTEELAAERDLDERVKELSYLISRHDKALMEIQKKVKQTKAEKLRVDDNLNKELEQYDSAYLSIALEKEKEKATLKQQLIDLQRIESLFDKIDSLTETVTNLIAKEAELEEKLLNARSKAERDTQNLERLKELFLDCLVRSEIAGFYNDDYVEMLPPFYLPEVRSTGIGDLAVTSYANLGSGGKKTLFKCCFAIAIHRLSVELNTLLPELLIIDSPMKNISERENRKQFEGFHNLLYELSQDELRNTQIILIDKEMSVPPKEFKSSFFSRYMQPNERDGKLEDNKFPPLITYYRDK